MCGFEQENTTETSFSMPLIGENAPSFVANTTNGIIKFPEQFRGHWVVLFSHPMDFTPVCTSEFISFQSMLKDFQELDTELVGLSVGGIYSHLAWFRSIHDEINFNGWKNVNITFPVIEDMDMRISKLYGMIHPKVSNTKTVRAVFIIDTNGIIRTILYYPQTTGRNMIEIKRIIIALQTADAFKVATPADWFPGMKVIEPAPTTTESMHSRINDKNKDLDVQSWFFTLRALPEIKIYNKIKRTKKK